MRKLLQNSLFVAMIAWGLYAAQAHADMMSSLQTSAFAVDQR